MKKLRDKDRAYVEFAEDIAADVKSDYLKRLEERRIFEAQWVMNTNFLSGNQYCAINASGAVEDAARDYYWQEREVYNHIAPLVETRLAKLNRVRPKMSVRPASGDEDDVKTAKTASKILSSTYTKLELDGKIGAATYWSELTGTSFYKITWDSSAGKKLGVFEGKEVFEGDVRVDVCPPYEIFPSSLSCPDIESCGSIIHAKAVSVSEVKRLYDVDVEPESVDTLSVSGFAVTGGLGLASAMPASSREKTDAVLVLERYTRPTVEKPDGELCVVAANKLLYYGPLPYANGEDNRKDLPFVKQVSLASAGNFYGISLIERTIPLQRAYNAVKNRKHEFLNRIAMGIMAVEDGSVDIDNLAEEGLSPGKILVYRQGSTPPRLLDPGHVPSDFTLEEDRLLSEFISISGVSDIMRSSTVPSGAVSGVALQLLIEQDDTRLSVTAEHIRNAVRKIAKHILRLYKQFANNLRLTRISGDEGEIELVYFKSSDINCDDVVFETENELSNTPAARQNMMFELLKMGLLHDENGKLSDAMRVKILDVLGYGGWEQTKDTAKLHEKRAEKENLSINERLPEITEVDDHIIHFNTHVKFLLSSDFERLCGSDSELKERLLAHIREHKMFAEAEENKGAGLDGQG